MKHQDQLQFDPTFTAPYTIFKKVGSNTYFVNSQCILSNKKITVGEEYLLIDNTKDTGSKIRDVILADCYYRNGIIHLIVRDIRSQIVSTLDHGIEYPERDCTWLLIDMDYFKDRMKIKAIQSYCGCGNDPKKKTNTEVNHKSNHDDLLDFAF